MGRAYLNHNRILDVVIGGWQASGTIVSQSGQPFTVSIDSASYSGDVRYPNVIGNPHLKHPTINKWFNPAAYTRPLDGAYGNSGRNSLAGPRLNLFNLTAGKTYSLYENVKLQIRADAYNVINHPSFSSPNSTLDCPEGQTACTDSSTATWIQSVTVGGRNMQLGAHLTF